MHTLKRAKQCLRFIKQVWCYQTLTNYWYYTTESVPAKGFGVLYDYKNYTKGYWTCNNLAAPHSLCCRNNMHTVLSDLLFLNTDNVFLSWAQLYFVSSDFFVSSDCGYPISPTLKGYLSHTGLYLDAILYRKAHLKFWNIQHLAWNHFSGTDAWQHASFHKGAVFPLLRDHPTALGYHTNIMLFAFKFVNILMCTH